MLTVPDQEPLLADKINQRLVIPSSTYVFRTRCDCGKAEIETSYERKGYENDISADLWHTGKDYNASLEMFNKEKPRLFAPNTSISLSREELAKALEYIKAGKNPKEAPEFNDLFARNDEKRYLWLLTGTGLRAPKGWEDGRYETIKGEKFYPRIVVEFDKEEGHVMIPVGEGRLITQFNEAFGLPSETQEIAYPHKGHYIHFWFDPKEKEVAVRFGSYDHGDGHRCLYIYASCRRSDGGSVGSVRPVVREF